MILKRSLCWWHTPTSFIPMLVQCSQFMTSTRALFTISHLARLEQCAIHLLKLSTMTSGLQSTMNTIAFAWRQPKNCSMSHKEMALLHWYTRGQPLCGASMLTSGLARPWQWTGKQINHMRWQKYSRSKCFITETNNNLPVLSILTPVFLLFHSSILSSIRIPSSILIHVKSSVWTNPENTWLCRCWKWTLYKTFRQKHTGSSQS